MMGVPRSNFSYLCYSLFVLCSWNLALLFRVVENVMSQHGQVGLFPYTKYIKKSSMHCIYRITPVQPNFPKC